YPEIRCGARAGVNRKTLGACDLQRPGDTADSGLRLAHETEAEIVRRQARHAATAAGVADEVRDIGAVLAFDEATAAIRGARHGFSGIVEPVAGEAGRGPLPDITGDVDKAVLVDAKAAIGARRAAGDALGLAFEFCNPALRGIVI